jgi:hypothetical protein
MKARMELPPAVRGIPPTDGDAVLFRGYRDGDRLCAGREPCNFNAEDVLFAEGCRGIGLKVLVDHDPLPLFPSKTMLVVPDHRNNTPLV